ncbi:hypothetical protein [Geoglobus sp.]
MSKWKILYVVLAFVVVFAGCSEKQIEDIKEQITKDTITINGQTYEIEKGTDVIFIRNGKPMSYKFEGNYMVFNKYGKYWAIPDKEDGMVIMADGQMSEISKDDIIYFDWSGNLNIGSWKGDSYCILDRSGGTYGLTEGDIVYFAKGEIQFADWIDEAIILVKGDYHFYGVNFDEVVYFKDRRPYYVEYNNTGAIIIQNGKVYTIDNKITEIVLETGERYGLS